MIAPLKKINGSGGWGVRDKERGLSKLRTDTLTLAKKRGSITNHHLRKSLSL